MRAIVLMQDCSRRHRRQRHGRGTVITLDQTVNGAPGRPQVMYIEPDRLRMSSPENDMIYRGDQNKVWIVRPEDKAYIELTPESMSQMKAQMDQRMAMMQQQMASMPPEQRKQMEAMMASRGMGPSAPATGPQITYEKAGEPKKVGDYSCTPFKVTMSAGPTSEFCMAKLSDIGLSRDDLKSFVAFGAFMGQMGGTGTQRSPMATIDFDALKKADRLRRLPGPDIHSSPDGSHNVETTLKSIQHQDPPAGTFDLPAGYTKRQDMGPGMGGPGMGRGGPRPPG